MSAVTYVGCLAGMGHSGFYGKCFDNAGPGYYALEILLFFYFDADYDEAIFIHCN